MTRIGNQPWREDAPAPFFPTPIFLTLISLYASFPPNPKFSNANFPQVKHKNLSAYNRLRALCASPTKRFYVFPNEHHKWVGAHRRGTKTAWWWMHTPFGRTHIT